MVLYGGAARLGRRGGAMRKRKAPRPEEPYITAGAYLRALRESLRWAQKDVARMADVYEAQVSRIENGRRLETANLMKIAAVFGYEGRYGDFWQDAHLWRRTGTIPDLATPGYRKRSPWPSTPASPRRLAA
jgi:transcriptional regulator with XRE-family HTH domain